MESRQPWELINLRSPTGNPIARPAGPARRRRDPLPRAPPWRMLCTDGKRLAGILCPVQRSCAQRKLTSVSHDSQIRVTMKRLLDTVSLQAMARGCGVLGAGGGGDVHYCLLQALQASEDYGPVPLVDVDELPDDALIMPCGAIGSPLVGIEKFENGDEGDRLRDYLQYLTGRRVAALMAGEIGGGNGLLPIAWAARLGLPLVDADGMGRAFPEVPQVAMHLAGIPASPAVVTDERGNLVVFRTISGPWMERLERAASIEFGGAASSTEYSMTAAQARQATVRNSVSLAIRIAEAIGSEAGNPVADMIGEIGA